MKATVRPHGKYPLLVRSPGGYPIRDVPASHDRDEPRHHHPPEHEELPLRSMLRERSGGEGESCQGSAGKEMIPVEL